MGIFGMIQYKMILDDTIISPVIRPNNPNHDDSHYSIPKEIRKTGQSMIKNKLIKSYKIVITNE